MKRVLALLEKFDQEKLGNVAEVFNPKNPTGQIIIIFMIFLICSFLINFFLSRSFIGSSYRLFVAPGVIIHELSHALLCMCTGAKITKISLFEKDGGRVEHHPPKIPVLGQVLISIAPMVFGLAIIFILAKLLGINNEVSSIFPVEKSMFLSWKNSLLGLDYSLFRNWILLYLCLSVVVTMTPSLQDFRNILLSVVFISFIFILLLYYEIIKAGNLAVPTEVIALASPTLLLLILSLLLSMILYVVSKIIHIK